MALAKTVNEQVKKIDNLISLVTDEARLSLVRHKLEKLTVDLDAIDQIYLKRKHETYTEIINLLKGND